MSLFRTPSAVNSFVQQAETEHHGFADLELRVDEFGIGVR